MKYISFLQLKFQLLITFSSLIVFSVSGQTTTDAIMMLKGSACIFLGHSSGSFDHYWEGGTLRSNRTIANVTRTNTNAEVAIGITSRLNAYVGLPYITTKSSEPNGGKFAGVSGFQDISVTLKYLGFQKKWNKSELSILGSFGFSNPITNYLSDYMPYNLGLGATQLSYLAIVQYDLDCDVYFRTFGGYEWRGYTKAEREYYYNNGNYFTPWMDVPSAVRFGGVIGAWVADKTLQLEINYNSLQSTSGDDIRSYAGPQPTNKVSMSSVGFFAHYFLNRVPGLGIIVQGNTVVSGQNTAKASTLGAGITYQFKYKK